jgi:hypothetical protein
MNELKKESLQHGGPTTRDVTPKLLISLHFSYNTIDYNQSPNVITHPT